MNTKSLYERGFLSAFIEDVDSYSMSRRDLLAMISEDRYRQGRSDGLHAHGLIHDYVIKGDHTRKNEKRKLKLDKGTIDDLIKYHRLYEESKTPLDLMGTEEFKELLNNTAYNLNYLNLGVKVKEAEHLAMEYLISGVSYKDFFHVKGCYYFTYKKSDDKKFSGYTLYKKDGLVVLRRSGSLKSALTLEEVVSAGYRLPMFTRKLANFSITYYEHSVN